MKVVVTSLFGDGFEESLLEEFPGLDLVFASTEEDQAREIRDADVFMGEPTREVFIEAQRLRWLHCPGTGISLIASIRPVIRLIIWLMPFNSA